MRYGSGKDDVLVWKILKDGEYVSLHEATFVLPDHYGAFSPIFVAIAINREIRLGINLFCRTVRMGDNPKKMRDVRKVGSLVETYGWTVGTHIEIYVSVPEKKNTEKPR